MTNTLPTEPDLVLLTMFWVASKSQIRWFITFLGCFN